MKTLYSNGCTIEFPPMIIEQPTSAEWYWDRNINHCGDMMLVDPNMDKPLWCGGITGGMDILMGYYNR